MFGRSCDKYKFDAKLCANNYENNGKEHSQSYSQR